MKFKKIIFFVVLLSVFLSPKIKAESMYNEMFEALPKLEEFQNQDILDDYGITLEDENWAKNLTPKTVLEIFKELINDISKATTNLVNKANQMGGYDNITVVIVKN